MATSRAKKEEQFSKIKKNFGEAKGIVFSNYRGLTVADISNLRKELRKENAEYVVIKKTLIRKAAEEIGIKDISSDILQGPIGIAFGYDDEVAAARLTNQFSKKNKSLELKGGIINGSLVSADEIKNLASLPSLDQLRAKVVGGFISPVRGFVSTINGVASGFVRVLDAICKQKA